VPVLGTNSCDLIYSLFMGSRHQRNTLASARLKLHLVLIITILPRYNSINTDDSLYTSSQKRQK